MLYRSNFKGPKLNKLIKWFRKIILLYKPWGGKAVCNLLCLLLHQIALVTKLLI